MCVCVQERDLQDTVKKISRNSWLLELCNNFKNKVHEHKSEILTIISGGEGVKNEIGK